MYSDLKMETLGTVRHLEFDWKWMFTVLTHLCLSS